MLDLSCCFFGRRLFDLDRWTDTPKNSGSKSQPPPTTNNYCDAAVVITDQTKTIITSSSSSTQPEHSSTNHGGPSVDCNFLRKICSGTCHCARHTLASFANSVVHAVRRTPNTNNNKYEAGHPAPSSSAIVGGAPLCERQQQ